METTMPAAAASRTISRESLVLAFADWAKPLELTPSESEYAAAAIEEMVELTPALALNWYLCNQYRWRHMRELERRRIRSVTHKFLVELGTGKVKV